jgi:hypothetical protein
MHLPKQQFDNWTDGGDFRIGGSLAAHVAGLLSRAT